MILQGFHVVVVRCVDRVVEVIGGGEAAEHADYRRSPRQVICAVLGVLARAVRLGRPGVQHCGIDEHRCPIPDLGGNATGSVRAGNSPFRAAWLP